MTPIALITDFGLQDAYVGIMKGVIMAIAPTVSCLDLTHMVPPQDIRAAQFHLITAYPYLPSGTVYLIVVDPGVGSDRRAIAVRFPWGTVVCPDNGILTGLLGRHPSEQLQAVTLTQPAYWRSHHGTAVPQVSATFHGRDIFAPVAAHLARGTPLMQVGTPTLVSSLVQLPDLLLPEQATSGVIQYIDHFGNLISTIPAAAAHDSWVAVIGDGPVGPARGPRAIPSGKTYSSVAPGQLVALVGSHGWIEIAAHGGRASDMLQGTIGQPVAIRHTKV
ncbi:MAG: SAM-dependent chlorinase/fluorinase [Elainellaceae cyanobacterium]